MSKDYNSLEYKKEHHKKKWHTDVKWRNIQLVYCAVQRALSKKAKPYSYIGRLKATSQQVKDHLEKQFTEGMNWSNYGTYWQVNHRVPLREAYDQGRRAFKEAQHYTNLEPKLREENCKEKKGKTFTKRVSRATTRVVQ